MLNVLIAIGVFATILLFIQAAQNIYTTVLGPEHQRFRRRLRRAAEQQSESSLLLVKTLHITFPWFDKLIARMPPGLQRLPAQANDRVSLEKLFSLSLLCGFVGLIGSLVVNAGSLTILCAMLLGFLFHRLVPAGHAFVGPVHRGKSSCATPSWSRAFPTL